MSKVQIGDATLYLGDSMEILQTLDEVDAVVTDPPYGIGFQYENDKDSRDGYEDNCRKWFGLCKKLAKGIAISPGQQNIVMWAHIEPWKHQLAWHKPNSIGRTSIGFCNWEPIRPIRIASIMPQNTYTPLGAVTLAASTSSVTFAVPSGYKDLVLAVDGATQATGDIGYRLNADSSSIYSYVIMYGTGSSASSGQGTTTYGVMQYNNTTSRCNVLCNFFDVNATDKHKTAISRGNQADGFVMSYGTRWASTAAVTSLRVEALGTNFTSGTTLNLWGIV